MTGIVIENNQLPFILVALVFFPSIIIFVVGFEIWREWVKGEHIEGLMMAPKNKKGLAIHGRIWLRMFLCFIGAGLAMLVSELLQKI